MSSSSSPLLPSSFSLSPYLLSFIFFLCLFSSYSSTSSSSHSPSPFSLSPFLSSSSSFPPPFLFLYLLLLHFLLLSRQKSRRERHMIISRSRVNITVFQIIIFTNIPSPFSASSEQTPFNYMLTPITHTELEKENRWIDRKKDNDPNKWTGAKRHDNMTLFFTRGLNETKQNYDINYRGIAVIKKEQLSHSEIGLNCSLRPAYSLRKLESW